MQEGAGVGGWVSAVCVDEQNIFIRAITCPGFLKVTDAGAACSWKEERNVRKDSEGFASERFLHGM